MKCKVEERMFLDPDKVMERFDELYSLIAGDYSDGRISAAYNIGYIKAHVERDAEKFLMAVEDAEEEK